MPFHFDAQILKDIFGLFDNTLNNITQAALERKFREVLTDKAAIAYEQQIIQSFIQQEQIIAHYYYYRAEFHECYHFLEHVPTFQSAFDIKLNHILGSNEQKAVVTNSLKQVVLFYDRIYNKYLQYLDIAVFPSAYQAELEYILQFIQDLSIAKYASLLKKERLKTKHLKELYRILLQQYNLKNIEQFYTALIRFEVYLSIAKTAVRHHFCFPTLTENILDIQQFYHPLLKHPIANDWKIQQSLCLLTGPNMAGKSTLLKALSIIVYLAHLGFPVPAKTASIPLYKNCFIYFDHQDNIHSGTSYFMEEVNRLKEAVQLLQTKESAFIVFDELFKGTNYEDATHITQLTIDALCKVKNAHILISTHLNTLQSVAAVQNRVIGIYQLGCQIIDNEPTFDYTLTEGWSAIKIGTLLFEKVGLTALLNKL